jgi:hypothetical protein
VSLEERYRRIRGRPQCPLFLLMHWNRWHVQPILIIQSGRRSRYDSIPWPKRFGDVECFA